MGGWGSCATPLTLMYSGQTLQYDPDSFGRDSSRLWTNQVPRNGANRQPAGSILEGRIGTLALTHERDHTDDDSLES